MFEYHCWATVLAHGMEAESALGRALAARIAALDEMSRGSFHLTTLNGFYLSASGQRNHYAGDVLEVFWWLAEQCPTCYGLMYLLGEQPDEDGKYRFKVQRIAHGRIEYLEDRYFTDLE